MIISRPLRRVALAVTSLGAGAAVLAACGADQSSNAASAAVSSSAVGSAATGTTTSGGNKPTGTRPTDVPAVATSG